MSFRLPEMEREIFKRIFGEGKSPDRISLGTYDPDDEETVYFSDIATTNRIALSFEYDFPGCVEEYSIRIVEYRAFSFVLVDMEHVAGESILIGVASKPSLQFLQEKLIAWWHFDNASPPSRFCVEDERLLSQPFIRELMDNENRPSFMTDSEFDAWIDQNLSDTKEAM